MVVKGSVSMSISGMQRPEGNHVYKCKALQAIIVLRPDQATSYLGSKKAYVEHGSATVQTIVQILKGAGLVVNFEALRRPSRSRPILGPPF